VTAPVARGCPAPCPPLFAACDGSHAHPPGAQTTLRTALAHRGRAGARAETHLDLTLGVDVLAMAASCKPRSSVATALSSVAVAYEPCGGRGYRGRTLGELEALGELALEV